MKPNSITVRADWDEAAHVWVATSKDIDGLALEEATIENLQVKVVGAIRDFTELNERARTLTDVPVRLVAERFLRPTRVPN